MTPRRRVSTIHDRVSLRVYELPDDTADQQRFIDRAEEDLLCALSLYTRRACGYLPLVTVCFLLHQAMEKWLKAFLAVNGTPQPKTHDLYKLLEAANNIEPQFLRVREEIEKVNSEILGQKFPSDIRYEDTPPGIEKDVEILFQAARVTRRLVKQSLKEEGG
jgi:HEPN domain-containing protein